MLSELLFGFILWIAVSLFIIAVGSELFAIMIDERLRYLRLIVNYAPLPATVSIPTRPEPVARYASYAVGENQDPVGCVHIRHSGRIRYGKTGRWMNMGGEAFFSLATPGFCMACNHHVFSRYMARSIRLLCRSRSGDESQPVLRLSAGQFTIR